MANDEEPQQSGENKAASKIDDDEPQLVAGRKPAGKLDLFIFILLKMKIAHKLCMYLNSQHLLKGKVRNRHCEIIRISDGATCDIVCALCVHVKCQFFRVFFFVDNFFSFFVFFR